MLCIVAGTTNLDREWETTNKKLRKRGKANNFRIKSGTGKWCETTD